MKKSAGIILIGDFNGEPHAVLRSRGLYKISKEPDGTIKVTSESYPGALQVSAHGGLDPADGDSHLNAAQREIKEELGFEFVNPALTPDSLVTLVEEKVEDTPDKPGKHVVTYGLRLRDNSLQVLQAIRLEWSSGHLVLLPKSQVDRLQPLDPKADKKDGIKDRDTYKMFAGEIAAVKLAFEKLA